MQIAFKNIPPMVAMKLSKKLGKEGIRKGMKKLWNGNTNIEIDCERIEVFEDGVKVEAVANGEESRFLEIKFTSKG